MRSHGFGVNKATRSSGPTRRRWPAAALALNPPNAHADLHWYEKAHLEGLGSA
ncbi:MAG: hypothetical protein R3F43_12230 [bacterium]